MRDRRGLWPTASAEANARVWDRRARSGIPPWSEIEERVEALKAP